MRGSSKRFLDGHNVSGNAHSKLRAVGAKRRGNLTRKVSRICLARSVRKRTFVLKTFVSASLSPYGSLRHFPRIHSMRFVFVPLPTAI